MMEDDYQEHRPADLSEEDWGLRHILSHLDMEHPYR